jgi:NCS2 family nucleobase:cation symporter-2
MTARPKDLLHAENERPPTPALIAFGFQQVAVICPYFVMVALVVEAARLPHDDARSAMGLAMLAVAFATVLQSLRLGPIGSGHLCPPVVSAIYLPSAMSAAGGFGFGGLCGMMMFGGLCEIVVGRLLVPLRKYSPPVVVGIVVLAVGIQLGKIGFGVIVEPVLHQDPRAPWMLLTAGVVLAATTGLAIWGRGQLKHLCVLIGVLLGYAVAAVAQVFPANLLAKLADSPIFALPDPGFLSYGFAPSLMLSFALAGLASGLRAVGVLTTCQQINDAEWRRPDLKRITAGVTADGIGCVVGGAVAGAGMSASPSLVGLQRATGVTSRVIAWSVAGWLVVLACLPPLASLIVNMPRPVMGAALFFNGALMLVAGIQLIVNRPVTLRASIVVGFSLLAALSVLIFPDFYKALPGWTRQITGSEVIMAVLVSVLLNALFRLGTRRTRRFRLGADGEPLTPTAFDAAFTRAAGELGIPAAELGRIRAVLDQAIELVSANAQGPLAIAIANDEFDVAVELSYNGNLPSLPDARPSADMVEEQSFTAGLTGYFSGLHADRIERSAQGEQCRIKLLFRL